MYWGHDDPSLTPQMVAAHDAAVAAGKRMYVDPKTGLYVITADFLAYKDACCGNGCRHCPYPSREQRAAHRPLLRPEGPWTERLVSRRFHPDDAEALFELYGDARVCRHLGRTPFPSVAAQRASLLENHEKYANPGGVGAWTMWSRADGGLVGTAICNHPRDAQNQPSPDVQVGWHVVPRLWRRGYGREIGQAMLTHGLQTLGLERVICLTEPPNTASLALARSLGLTELGTTRDYYGGLELVLFEQRRG